MLIWYLLSKNKKPIQNTTKTPPKILIRKRIFPSFWFRFFLLGVEIEVLEVDFSLIRSDQNKLQSIIQKKRKKSWFFDRSSFFVWDSLILGEKCIDKARYQYFLIEKGSIQIAKRKDFRIFKIRFLFFYLGDGKRHSAIKTLCQKKSSKLLFFCQKSPRR